MAGHVAIGAPKRVNSATSLWTSAADMQRVCKTSGGVVRRHDSIRGWLAKFIRDVTGRATLTEQFVPRWARQNDQGQLVRARLDVAFADSQGRRVYLDVAVSDPATPNVHELRHRANRNGAAAMREEDAKRQCYPGPDLTPFVVESLGRMGPSADAFLRAVVPKDMENRALVLGQARQSLSVLLQTGTAECQPRREIQVSTQSSYQVSFSVTGSGHVCCSDCASEMLPSQYAFRSFTLAVDNLVSIYTHRY